MSGVDQQIIFSINRIAVTFCDDIGNIKTIHGTGFWLKTDDKLDIFITNKHNLDPCLKLGKNTKFKLKHFKIELRKVEETKQITCETKFFEVLNPEEFLTHHDTADLSIISSPKFIDSDDSFKKMIHLSQNLLADEEFFRNSVSLMDIGSFIGFPGKNKSKWWDQVCNYGIARSMNIASCTYGSFSHPDIATTDTMLVSGLSFSGSSGSIVILHQKYDTPPKILGIMSGHWQEETKLPEMFQHTGLSYFTRSISILELIEKTKT